MQLQQHVCILAPFAPLVASVRRHFKTTYTFHVQQGGKRQKGTGIHTTCNKGGNAKLLFLSFASHRTLAYEHWDNRPQHCLMGTTSCCSQPGVSAWAHPAAANTVVGTPKNAVGSADASAV